jgi:predicted tellurium resistance membrane protein TerC
MDWLTADNLVALLTLTVMEIVLGIDNLVFISILTGKVAAKHRALARRLGLGVALISRIILLLTITWVMGLTAPLFTLRGHEFSGRDLILIAGGLFLLFKATHEIYAKVEARREAVSAAKGQATLLAVLVQVMLIDLVFSLDSVITAVGMADHVAVMIIAVVIAMIVMILAVNSVSHFIERHPSVKILAMSFLLLIGVMLVAEGMGRHVEKGYLYAAMAFSLFVEMLHIRMERRRSRTRRASR